MQRDRCAAGWVALCLVAAATVLSGCGGDDSLGGPTSDGGGDAVVDTGTVPSDSHADSPLDAPPRDSSIETSVDATGDVALDSIASDASSDAQEGGNDAGMDGVAMDSSPDAPADSGASDADSAAGDASDACVPPTIGTVSPGATCDAQGAISLTIAGSGFQTGATVTAGIVPASTVTVNSATQIQATFLQGSLVPGTYDVKVVNPDGCQATAAGALVDDAPPTITNVAPPTVCVGGGTLTVNGTGFVTGDAVSLGSFAASSVTVASPTQLQATFGGGVLMPGTSYDVTVSGLGCAGTLPSAVTAVAGASLFWADPPVAYNGITTQVSLFFASLTPPLGSVTITASGGGPAIPLTAQVDPLHPSRVLANVPAGTPPTTYDITAVDASGCPAILPMGLKVVNPTTVSLASMTPGFGWQNGTTQVAITAAGGLLATPHAYLNPHTATSNDVATRLGSVAFVSATELTADVPPGVDPAKDPYDLIVVNPDGTVGVLPSAYQSNANPPPVIEAVTPISVQIPTTLSSITISGANFDTAPPPSVLFTCGANVFPAMVQMATASSVVVSALTLDNVSVPSLCTINLTNADGSFATFEALAMGNASGSLAPSVAGTSLPQALRGLSLVSNGSSNAARFLYAIGGDNGTAAGATSTVYSIPANQNGTGAAWFTQRYPLNGPRTLAGAATLGRYLYVAGGNDGTGPVGTVERAIVLDPGQVPTISDWDLVPGAGTGLGGGIWYYRVAALASPTDPDNPGGEMLPSDELSVQLPDLPGKLQVSLTWTQVPGAVGYRIYRSPTAGLISGQEQHLADVLGGATLTFVDTGAPTIATDPPALVLGSTGVWRVLPTMSTPRESPGVVFGADPITANAYYLYATFGRSPGGALGTYEYLPVTVASTGQQTFGAWQAGAQTDVPRYQHMAYAATNASAPNVPAGETFIYVGGGTQNGLGALFSLDAGQVQAGGDLGTFVASGKTLKHFGAGSAAIGNNLYDFSGDSMSTGFDNAIISTSPPAVSTVNNNGSGLLMGRYLPGSVLEGALIYLAGGSSSGFNSATSSVEWLVY